MPTVVLVLQGRGVNVSVTFGGSVGGLDAGAELLGVDVGGTFTDAVLAVGGRLVTAKAPTTPHDQSEGVLAAVRAALERAGAAPDEIEAFAHGTTIATNALLEGKGAGILV
jgi:N-methylhydantoinase A/oxoprolinase/acetone carboxylase beta subunit